MSVTRCRKTEENRGHKISNKLDKYERIKHQFKRDESSFEKRVKTGHKAPFPTIGVEFAISSSLYVKNLNT